MISMPAAGPTPPSPVPGTRPAGTRDETDASREVRQMFSRIAPRYDLLNHLLSLRFDIFWRKRLARRFAHILARPGARVLDVCCGTGDLTLAFAHTPATAGASQTRSILGVDFAHPMLVRARQKSPGAQLHFIEADALSLPFPDATFHLVTTAFGFRNLANYTTGLRELRRILAPGGSIAILEFAEPKNAFFRNAFGFYFHRVLPLLGGIISGSAQAYHYLPESVARFPPPSELLHLMEGSGFAEVSFESWTAGIVTLHSGIARD